MDIQAIVSSQRERFKRGEIPSLEERKENLRKLKESINNHYDSLLDALDKDLGKCSSEAIFTELGMVTGEIDYMVKHLKKFAKPRRVRSPLAQFPSKSKVYMEPFGSVLIIAPWNYPVHLSLLPMVAALAAGNRVVLKPSEYSPASSKEIKDLIEEIFPADYVAVVEGDASVSSALLDLEFDYIFFTGSERVGKIVMEKASKHLTPVTLELGGKSPVIVDSTANIKLAARRIMWGKLLNAGQTCVAPDYVLVDRTKQDELLEEMKKCIVRFFGEHPEASADYPCIVNEKHLDRLKGLLTDGTLYYGGTVVESLKKMAPALVKDPDWDSPLMKEEIFGPILPVIAVDSLEEAIGKINSRPKPLALYLFTNDKETKKKVLSEVSFGGGCVNDTMSHLGNRLLPFGGVGNSGMGNYHGRYGFMTFSHEKGVLSKGRLDIRVRYAPYKKRLNWLFRRIM